MIQKEYVSKNHSKFLLKYHIIFVCKYCRKILIGSIATCVKNILIDIANKSDFRVESVETDKDHVHLLVNSDPKVSPLQIVRRLKQESTKRLWALYPEALRRWLYRKHTLWTDGYFVSSIGNVSQETVRKYIENQEKQATPSHSSPKLKT